MELFKRTNLDKTELLLLYIMKELEADKAPVKLSYNQLQDNLWANRNTTSKAIKGLKEQGLLSVTVGQGKASNTYYLTLETVYKYNS
ncbi:GntR family transcriptional regulator [Bacillus cereus group sp. BY9-3LC]|uniref:GntR family transcriptional regulator n=1 Tax=Bacillus cereus group sp. BY9-3LC TaxID=3018075 RepID=UPI0022E86838|nr:GntR family transcriptional regulator [Bacillus cereus group sp. BY9-3LC]MDA1776023.1 GntR family transcriptional regulator [Bacillus cereus group sp. BY9-3LC]